MNWNKLFLRWIAVFGISIIMLASNLHAGIIDTDTFDNDMDGWSGPPQVNWNSGTQRLFLNRDDTATKTFTFPSYANQTIRFTLEAIEIGEWDNDDYFEVRVNGTRIMQETIDGTTLKTFTATLDSSGSVTIAITPNTDSNSKDLYVDNLSVHYISQSSANGRDFAIRNPIETRNIFGNIKTVGNSVLCYKENGVCVDTDWANNQVSLSFIDTDSVNRIYNNSSRAQISGIPDSARIVWAGFYTQGYLKTTQVNTLAQLTSSPTYLTTPQGAVLSLGNDVIDIYPYQTDQYTYSTFTKVTQLEGLNGSDVNGWFTGANIKALEGDDSGNLGYFGAWSLVLIYTDQSQTLKNISVYDGYKQIGGANDSITVNGFYTPTSGDVKSTLSVFVGEGDKNIAGDDITLEGQSLSSGATVNAFNSTVNGFLSDPIPINYQGIDIHNYDVGVDGNLSHNQIIGNGIDEATIGLTTTGDYYYPSMVSFTTELYQPQVCYYEDLYQNGVKLGSGAQVNYGDILNVKVYVTNKANETAERVKVYRTFDDSLPYVNNSTYLDNANPPYGGPYNKIYKTDSKDSLDRFDYNSTDKKFSIRIGTYTDSNLESGGNLVKNQGAAFDYNITVHSESNTSISYNVAYTNTAINFDYVGQIGKCVDFNNTFWGYRAPQTVTGDFNVVYADHANGALSSGYYYNLPTQITSRADNYKVISLDGNTLKDINTTVAVELVDADSSADCSTMTRISNLKTWIALYDTNETDLYAQDIIDGMILYDADAAKKFYQKAGKNIKFRISYPKDGTGGAIIMNETVPGKYHLNNFPSYAGSSCVYPVTATTYNPSNGNIQGESTYTQVPQACGNAGTSGASAMTQHEVNVCLECIYGTSVNYVCSRDNFSIRPEAFALKLYDQNQSNSATKQFMMNNTPSPVNKNMASGYRYYLDVNATNHLGTVSSPDYNTTEDIDFIWSSTKTGCNDDTNKSIAFNFANGLADGNVSVDQVGEYRLSIVDTVWTAVDSNSSLMTHHTSPYFILGTNTDCIANSAVSSAVGSGTLNGCNVDTNHTNSVTGVTYTDSNVTFHPYKFDMTTLNFGVGTQPQEINASVGSNRDFVYMSDMSRNDSMNMSVRATGTISARGENNATLSNFVDNCYAVNTKLSLNNYNTITLPNTTYQVRFVDTNGSGTVYDSNATNVTTSALAIPLMTLDDGNFTKDMSGSISQVTRLNYDRNETTPLDPMTVQYRSLDFQCVTGSECTMQANLSGSYEANGSRAMDFNVTHVYGRIIPRDVRVFGNVNFVANAWYEGYNMPTLNGAALEASKIDSMWYVNNVHTDANDGNGDVTVIIPTTPLALPTHSSSTAGMETYQFGAVPLTSIPYGGKAHINTDPWLWYGPNALEYADPGFNVNGTVDGTVDADDCFHHPCFNITVVPSIGATGSAKSGAEDKKASKKSDSGGGTWKSTSDYAPAIR